LVRTVHLGRPVRGCGFAVVMMPMRRYRLYYYRARTCFSRKFLTGHRSPVTGLRKAYRLRRVCGATRRRGRPTTLVAANGCYAHIRRYLRLPVRASLCVGVRLRSKHGHGSDVVNGRHLFCGWRRVVLASSGCTDYISGCSAASSVCFQAVCWLWALCRGVEFRDFGGWFLRCRARYCGWLKGSTEAYRLWLHL
jgi:hypothetical protein